MPLPPLSSAVDASSAFSLGTEGEESFGALGFIPPQHQ